LPRSDFLAFGLVRDVKTVPNFGIKLNALVAGGLGLVVFGLIGGSIAFLWYGGQDVIQHYIFRFVLHWKGHTPLGYTRFLD
jgi:hypothetical protein